MTDERRRAEQPEDLARFFVARANAGDAEGLAALYETDAVLAFPSGQVTVGREAIRAAYERFLATKPQLALGQQVPTLRNGDLALTATRLPSGDATTEVARRQPDGTWLWVLDRPSFVG
ncbi:MAG: YybH family protein [Ktedonobacterales bacterium]